MGRVTGDRKLDQQIPRLSVTEPLSPEDVQTLRVVSRQTWRFFEKFVTAEDHFLPPDNFQEEPKPESRTGLRLPILDLYLPLHDCGARLRLARHAGGCRSRRNHPGNRFTNWNHFAAIYLIGMTRAICTLSIRNTFPPSIAEILLVHFWSWGTIAANLSRESSIDARMFAGVKDCIQLLQEAMAARRPRRAPIRSHGNILAMPLNALAALLESVPSDARDWAARLTELRERAQTLDDIAQTLQQEEGHAQVSESRVWAAAIRACIDSHVRDAEILIPWLRLHSEIIAAWHDHPSQLRVNGRRWSRIFTTISNVGGGSGTIRCCSAGIALLCASECMRVAMGSGCAGSDRFVDPRDFTFLCGCCRADRRLQDIAHAAEKMFFEYGFHISV